MLTQAAEAREGGKPGPLVLVEGSDIYVYDFSIRQPAGAISAFAPTEPAGSMN